MHVVMLPSNVGGRFREAFERNAKLRQNLRLSRSCRRVAPGARIGSAGIFVADRAAGTAPGASVAHSSLLSGLLVGGQQERNQFVIEEPSAVRAMIDNFGPGLNPAILVPTPRLT